MSAYIIPSGVIGIQGTAAAFARAEVHMGPLPSAWQLRSGDGMQIRFYRMPPEALKAGDDTAFVGYGLVVLLPGTVIRVAS